MSWQKPTAAEFWQAVDIYLAAAYDGPPPSAVRDRVQTLKSLAEADLYDSPVFERGREQPPARYALRLGNRGYPHMKLVIDRRPDGAGYLLRADTHDSHCCPPAGSREHGVFQQLMQMNHGVAQAIEAGWEAAGLPTFKRFLREDLARRVAKQASAER